MNRPVLPLHIALVRHTFRQVGPDYDRFARTIFNELFAIAPESRTLFNGELDFHRQKFIRFFALTLHHLDNPDELQAHLIALGIRHLSYGIEPHHYELMIEAIISALSVSLGNGFTRKVSESWYAVLMMVSEAAMGRLYPKTTQTD